MFEKSFEKIKKYSKYFCIFLFIVLIISTIIVRHYRIKNLHSKKKEIETFDNKYNKNTNLQIPRLGSDYASANYDKGLPIIIMKNSKIYYKVKLGVLENGTVSFEICKFIKKYIYPIDVLIYNDYFELFNSLQNEQTDMVFVNEDLLLKSIEKKDKYVLNNLQLNKTQSNKIISKNNPVLESNDDLFNVISPTYYEYMFFLTTKNNNISKMEDIEIPDSQTNESKIIGVWKNSKYYFYILCKNKNIQYLEEKNAKFQIIFYDNLINLFDDFINQKTNGIFLHCHPKNTFINQFMKIDTVKKDLVIIDLYDNSKSKINLSFIDNMKNDIKWLFKDLFNIKRIFEEDTEKKYLNTFKIRSLLVTKGNNAKQQLKNEVVYEFIQNFIKEYQSLNMFIKNWNKENNLDNNDNDSFNIDDIASTPYQLSINKFMKEELIKMNKLEIKQI